MAEPPESIEFLGLSSGFDALNHDRIENDVVVKTFGKLLKLGAERFWEKLHD